VRILAARGITWLSRRQVQYELGAVETVRTESFMLPTTRLEHTKEPSTRLSRSPPQHSKSKAKDVFSIAKPVLSDGGNSACGHQLPSAAMTQARQLSPHSETEYEHRAASGFPVSCPTLDLSVTWDAGGKNLLIYRPPGQVVSKIHQVAAPGSKAPEALAVTWKPDGELPFFASRLQHYKIESCLLTLRRFRVQANFWLWAGVMATCGSWASKTARRHIISGYLKIPTTG
jgi:hypothetical protein